MKNIFILLISFLLITPILSLSGVDIKQHIVSAQEKDDKDDDDINEEKDEDEEDSEAEDEEDIDDDIAELEAEDDEDEFEIEVEDTDENSEFEIAGTIASISGNTFTVAGETITIDLSKVEEFKQKGLIAAGNSVKVEGVIIDGQKFAKEIKVFGMGGKNIKIEIKNNSDEVKIKAKGPFDQIVNFLKQLFNL